MNFKSILCSTAMLGMSIAATAVGPSGSLPVMYINTENHEEIKSKEDYLAATYYIEGVDGFGTAETPLALQIRGRGNYTWTGYDKKPYRLKLDKKAELFGMNNSKHWALLAHADDNQGFMRNITGFQLARLIGFDYTPAEQPCEVVLNGEYIGLYFLTETVRVDKKRVNVYDWDGAVEDWIDEQEEAGNPGKTLADYMNENEIPADYTTGGWLVEIDNYDELAGGEQIHVGTHQQHPQSDWNHKIMITYDSPCDYITDAQKQWLASEFTAIDDMVFDSDKDNCRWAEKVDLTDLAKFFIVNQLVGNYESFHGSCKLWHAKGENEKWHFGPVWDFGSSFQEGRDMSKPIWDSEYVQHWIEEMYKFPAFQQEVARVYNEFMATNPIESLKEYQAQYAARIERAAQADKQRWPQYGNDNISDKLRNVQNKLQSAINAMPNIISGAEDTSDPTSYIYLRGELNGWGTSDKFEKNSDGIYELKLSNLNGKFKIAGPVWDEGNVDFGGATDIELNKAVKLTSKGGDCSLKDGSVNDVTLLFDWSTKELTIKGVSDGDGDGDGDGDIDENVEIYVRGDINGWGTSNKFEKNEDGLYELFLSNLNGGFKIADGSYGKVNYGGVTDIELNKAVKLSSGGGNCTLKNGAANDVTLIFNLATGELTVNGTEGSDGDGDGDEMGLTRRVYFKNDNLARAATWSTPHVYTWSPEAHGKFPGTAMTETSINGQQYWVSEWTVDSADQHKPGTTFLVFSDGSSTDGSDHKTSDQVYYHNQVYTATGASSEQLSGIAAVETDEAAPEYYSIQGTRVAADNLTPGLYIVRRGNKVSKIIVK
ncbi:MAG: CotH kinase family protein [Muribaculaceae bacterium]|nr:CotH kinase family protein [Muribaculaceae bacterium]